MQAVMAIAGIACVMAVGIYLASMARIAVFLQRRGRNDVGIGDPSGQLRVLGLILVIDIFVSIGTGFFHA